MRHSHFGWDKVASAMFAALLAGGCAGAGLQAQFMRGVQAKSSGDAQRFADDMFALAQAAPDTRQGRRARTCVQGLGWLSDVTVLQFVGGFIAKPAAPQRIPHAGEAQSNLQAIDAAQQRFLRTHKRCCTSFAQCRVDIASRAHYYYFLTDQQVAGGGDSQATVEIEAQVRATMKSQNIRPFVTDKHFYAVAIGLTEDPNFLDVWAIDEKHVLMHVSQP